MRTEELEQYRITTEGQPSMSDLTPPRTEIPPTMPLAVTLAAQQWLLVQQILGEGPYRLVQPLIDAIGAQCRAQSHTRMPGNGALAAEHSDARND